MNRLEWGMTAVRLCRAEQQFAKLVQVSPSKADRTAAKAMRLLAEIARLEAKLKGSG